MIESQPAAIMSANAVLPEPRAPMMATSPGLSGMTGVVVQWRVKDLDSEITCDGVADAGGSAPTCARPLRIDACLPQSIELQPALDPGEAVSERRGNVVELVRVTPVQAGLQPAVSGSDFTGAKIPRPSQNSRCAELLAKITCAKPSISRRRV